jgi:hypothetical protein
VRTGEFKETKKPTQPNTSSVLIASAYSLTGLPAIGRVTLYLVIRYCGGNPIYLGSARIAIIGVSTGEGEKIAEIFGILFLSLKT